MTSLNILNNINSVLENYLINGCELRDLPTTYKNSEKLIDLANKINEEVQKTHNVLETLVELSKACYIKSSNMSKILTLVTGEKTQTEKQKLLFKCKSWADIDEDDRTCDSAFSDVESTLKNIHTKSPNKIQKYNKPKYKILTNVNGLNIDNIKYKLPIVSKLKMIPPSIYWYNGDKKTPKGMYCCISEKNYVQIPFPDILTGSDKTKTIKCKHGSAETCKRFKTDLNYVCQFAHKSEKYNKLGFVARCPSNPSLGNHKTLIPDLGQADDSDIKSILMYALSDLALSSMWMQKQNKPKIWTNINIC
jgi:hypothetical protein